MVIEFIGSTGAGKTTLFSAVRRRLAQTTSVATAFEVVASPLGLQAVTQPSWQNAIQELVGLPYFLRSLHHHRDLVSFALRMMGGSAHSRLSLATLNTLRSLIRKIGVDEIIRQNSGHLVLVDEGLLLLAHNLFVYSRPHAAPHAAPHNAPDYAQDYTPEEVAEFATLIPLPDAVVYVKVPVESLVRRAVTRQERRREVRAANHAQLEKYIQRTVALYEQLVQLDAVRGRVLTVENPESATKVDDRAVEAISDFVLSRVPPVAVEPEGERYATYG